MDKLEELATRIAEIYGRDADFPGDHPGRWNPITDFELSHYPYARQLDLFRCTPYNGLARRVFVDHTKDASAAWSDDYLNDSPVSPGGPLTSKPT